MVSEASYPAVPTVGFKSPRQLVGLVIVLATFVGVFFVPKEFFFPALVAYDLWGLSRLVFFGLVGRREVADDMLVPESMRHSHEHAYAAPHERAIRHEDVGAHVLPADRPIFAAAERDNDLARRKRRRRRRRPSDRPRRGEGDDGDASPSSPPTT